MINNDNLLIILMSPDMKTIGLIKKMIKPMSKDCEILDVNFLYFSGIQKHFSKKISTLTFKSE